MKCLKFYKNTFWAKLSMSITFFFSIIMHTFINASWCNIFIIFFVFPLNPQFQQISFLSREEVKVLGEMRELTCPRRITPVAVPSEKPAPSATASLSGVSGSLGHQARNYDSAHYWLVLRMAYPGTACGSTCATTNQSPRELKPAYMSALWRH